MKLAWMLSGDAQLHLQVSAGSSGTEVDRKDWVDLQMGRSLAGLKVCFQQFGMRAANRKAGERSRL